jgi:hypothetical protein
MASGRGVPLRWAFDFPNLEEFPTKYASGVLRGRSQAILGVGVGLAPKYNDARCCPKLVALEQINNRSSVALTTPSNKQQRRRAIYLSVGCRVVIRSLRKKRACAALARAQALTPTISGADETMDEATHRVQQAPNQAQLRTMSVAVVVLARRSAIKAVKRQFQAQGLKLQRMAHREIVAAANGYLSNHPELLAEAKETVVRWQAEGVFGKRGGIRNPVHRAR